MADVTLTIVDGGAGTVVVPSTQVQVVIGCSSTGTEAQVVATRSARTLQTEFGYGFLPEYGAMCIAAGGTVLAMKAASNTAGTVVTGGSLTVTDATNASPIVITTSASHGLVDGAVVLVASVGGNTAANGTHVVDVLSATTFSLRGSTGNAAYTSGGTARFQGTIQLGGATDTSEVTITGTPNDDYFLLITITNGGTIGTNGITFTVSLDAGRSTGPNISLGTASTYVIAQTGMTINFSAGDISTGVTIKAVTTGPAFNTAGILACLDALEASPYAQTGWGSMHIVVGRAGMSAADAATIQGYLDTLATGFLYTRAKTSARDAGIPSAWGGTGESESTWQAALLTDYVSTDAKRMQVSAGFYNMPSAYPVPAAGAPRYRRALSWAEAARTVAIPPQRHSGRVRDGALSQIVIDPTTDPEDGFIYHDNRITPGLDFKDGGSGRFTSATTRVRLPGFYVVNPLMMAAFGSDFWMYPYGSVMDIACQIVHQQGQLLINSDIRLNDNGTIYANEAKAIEQQIGQAIFDNMTAVNMISNATVSVDLTNNVRTTQNVNITVTIYARGYVLSETITIGFGSAAALA